MSYPAISQNAALNSTSPGGWMISEATDRLRNYFQTWKATVTASAGWFLALRKYEWKYQLGEHLFDDAELANTFHGRLNEMRAGHPDASVRPQLRQFLDDIQNAPSEIEFLNGLYGIVRLELITSLKQDLSELDPVANAAELRLLHRAISCLEKQMKSCAIFELTPNKQESAWTQYLQKRFMAIGGFHGKNSPNVRTEPMSENHWSRPGTPLFERPQTILFDERIRIGSLVDYQTRLQLSPKEATREQFKVFFNELYAAALLASILHDAAKASYPWEFFADFSRHFWDELRHSQFGAIRLKELGFEPDVCNPILFEQTESLPVLHRVVYLTRGLESYFMPRKPKRVKEYIGNGDARSQLFADHDWSDEITHVRFGSKWSELLLESDHREVEDVIEEVKVHLSRVRGELVSDISAPF